MPRFDGTGPQGTGPLTGRGEGYCAIQLPDPTTGQSAVGFAGLGSTPVQVNRPLALRTPIRQLRLVGRGVRRWVGRGRSWNAGRRRGGRFGMHRR